ncbi:ATP synthase subunit I [Brevibacillus ruminantium]|uniref:ATP synthase subunit I n=1 Tax=Brevibacillus ruminantium TaxID=2950604 RepID=A0ABY4WDZ9_9BACL|nr:ATP synthase subunit I [Brevibacillus ruminantium]USG65413.1 ATP synthase subunit I [Brevibacillus ruminantium]
MEPIAHAMRKTFRYAFYCLAFAAILLVLLPGYALYWQGLLIGIVGGMINTIILFTKVWRVGQVADNPGYKPGGTGTIQRFLVAGLAGYLTVLFPNLFNLAGVLIGLFLVHGLSSFFVYRSLQ